VAQQSGMGTLMKLGLIAVGGYFIYEWFFAAPVAAAAPVSTAAVMPVTPTATATQAAPASTPTVVPGMLDSTFLALQNVLKNTSDSAVSQGGTMATFSVFNYYLSQVSGVTGLPEYSTLFGAPDPNVPIPLSTYWTGMAPWLTKNKGMGGIGFFAGLGALAIGAMR
jgi:hypothetical protein